MTDIDYEAKYREERSRMRHWEKLARRRERELNDWLQQLEETHGEGAAATWRRLGDLEQELADVHAERDRLRLMAQYGLTEEDAQLLPDDAEEAQRLAQRLAADYQR